MRAVLSGLLVTVSLMLFGSAFAATPDMELGQFRGYWARPVEPGQPDRDLLARWQRFDITTRGFARAGWLQAENGAFGQNTLEIRDAMGRYTGELDSFAGRYEIRDAYGHTLGWFDTWGAFSGEIRVQDDRNREVGRLRDVFGDGSMMRLRGTQECIALFAKMGITLNPGLTVAGRERIRSEIFERFSR